MHVTTKHLNCDAYFQLYILFGSIESYIFKIRKSTLHVRCYNLVQRYKLVSRTKNVKIPISKANRLPKLQCLFFYTC